MNGAEVLLRTLLAAGVDVCFMNPGTSEMQFVAALDRVPGMRGVLCLFEGVCSGAADGYARMLGRPASTLLHLGPGLANSLANFHNARKAKSPIVSIVGEHSTQHLRYDAPLSADIHTFAASVSSEILTPGAAGEIGAAASETIRSAMRPPGQIAHLIVPADFSWSEAGEPGAASRVIARRPPAESTIREVGKLLRSGRDVSLILGGTALLEKGLAAAEQLASHFGVRVFAHRNAGRLSSGRGRFQPERIAYFPEPAIAQLEGTRHLILVEAAAPVSFFGYPNTPSLLAPPDAEVHVLATAAEDGTGALQRLAELAGAPAMVVSNQPRTPAPWSDAYDDAALTPDLIGIAVAAALPEDAIVCDEMISSSQPVSRHLLTAARHEFLPVTGGSIGQGLPVAVGAAVASPERKVVALEADGSAMYTFQALWTMVREQLDVTAVIFNNRRYRILDVEMQRTGANGFGPIANDMIDIGRPDLDFVKMSEAFRVPATRARTGGEFRAQFTEAMRTRGPRLIEAIL